MISTCGQLSNLASFATALTVLLEKLSVAAQVVLEKKKSFSVFPMIGSGNLMGAGSYQICKSVNFLYCL